LKQFHCGRNSFTVGNAVGSLPLMRKNAQIVILVSLAFALSAGAQPPSPTLQTMPLDPTRNLATLPRQAHAPLPEQYLWTANDVTARRPDHNKYPWNRPELRIEPHFFRVHFNVKNLPHTATVYIAGPREAHIYLNGHLLDDFYSNIDAPIGFHVFHANASTALRSGDNVLAVQVVRGRGVVAGAGPLETQQLAYGEVLVAKLTPAAFGIDAPALVYTNTAWKSSSTFTENWPEPGFDDSGWQSADSLGPVESNVDFFQWSADAGMYGWPGYVGMSSELRTYSLSAAAVTHVFPGRSAFANLEALTSGPANGLFTVATKQPEASHTDAEAPSFLLDFGREVSGRLLVESASSQDSMLSIAYGESEVEAMATGITPGQQGGNYLGTNMLEVPANGIARGPKSGFRYVRIRFLRGAPVIAFKSIRLEGIYYPVEYKGTFESSDPVLNRIWETGAYTAHLCMQDGIWDAPKRDRGRWAGDLDVEGRVISTVFGDTRLIEETLGALVPSGDGHVNGIPGYSALWITSLFNLYSHAGNKTFVASQREALLHILAAMDDSLDASGLFTNPKHQWLFVDWAPRLYGYTPEAIIGTNLQYVIAYNRASLLFHMLGDQSNADKYSDLSRRVLAVTRSSLRDHDSPAYGTTWQLNALALLAFENDSNAASILWSSVLSHVKQDSPADPVISPYFNVTVLDAMSALGHDREALDWIRTYWGGMLAEGATSFWESYDLRWPKTNPHLSLQADGTSGYFVSLAHGWSSGPTAWLSENVLGIREPQNGYKSVIIAPHLSGLDWARGTIPTPQGVIAISVDKHKGISLDLPAGVEKAFVVLPLEHRDEHLYLNGTLVADDPMLTAHVALLTRAGHYEITTESNQ
jgi:alpha-L-rhamnosidase